LVWLVFKAVTRTVQGTDVAVVEERSKITEAMMSPPRFEADGLYFSSFITNVGRCCSFDS